MYEVHKTSSLIRGAAEVKTQAANSGRPGTGNIAVTDGSNQTLEAIQR